MNVFKTIIIKILQSALPDRVKNSLFHMAFHIARSEFEKFSFEYNFAPNMNLGLEAMALRGFSPVSVVDVGAFEGDWSKLAKRIWPKARIFMVEPNLQKRDMLLKLTTDIDATAFFELLGAEDGREVSFHLMESGSSIMEERSAVPRTVEKRKLRTLDSLLSNVEGPALLKIDAQGYEQEIIKGASTILQRFEAVLIEVAIIEINVGAPLLHDMVPFMKTHGFVAYDILEIHRRPLDKALNQVDIIFIKESSPLIADKRHFA